MIKLTDIPEVNLSDYILTMSQSVEPKIKFLEIVVARNQRRLEQIEFVKSVDKVIMSLLFLMLFTKFLMRRL